MTGYLAHFMLKRELKFCDDPITEFMRLGARCLGPRTAKPEDAVTLREKCNEGHDERKAARLAASIKKRQVRAAHRLAQRVLKLARLREGKKKGPQYFQR